ncbi:Gfo/Idh/MocA family protein [Cereibacter johrii]|uniref:Dehydrogenase n=1 Tax=Cereibacter johrii TaxID=445629 RepID=A0ABX5J727_9RHOB|nr:Gfo/Idh/MocA family oxidoreductase [Cereibacter johrii]ODM42715.1 oxidoreductase [Cereibacter johrii]PTM78986.1 putative dehydrogenase [Cereibacter johrii]
MQLSLPVRTRPRLAFVGLGWIGRARMEALARTGRAEIVALADPDAAAIARAQELAPDAVAAGSLAEALTHRPDGVVIATPSARHAAETLAALEAGCAVFCQKPLGRSADEVRAVVGAAARADRLLGVDLSYRLTAATSAIRPLVASGELGRVFAIDLTFHNAYGPDKPWFYDRALSGGGCVMDLGVHLVDLALWSLDWPEVTRVEAQMLAGGRPAAAHEVEDYAVATLQTASGCVIRLACSWKLQAGREAVIEAQFHGTEGGAALTNVGGSFYDFAAHRHRGTASEPLTAPPDDWGGRALFDWADRLAAGQGFDPEARHLVTLHEVLDRIHAAGTRAPAGG